MNIHLFSLYTGEYSPDMEVFKLMSTDTNGFEEGMGIAIATGASGPFLGIIY